jgi:hypothetical protein
MPGAGLTPQPSVSTVKAHRAGIRAEDRGWHLGTCTEALSARVLVLSPIAVLPPSAFGVGRFLGVGVNAQRPPADRNDHGSSFAAPMGADG